MSVKGTAWCAAIHCPTLICPERVGVPEQTVAVDQQQQIDARSDEQPSRSGGNGVTRFGPLCVCDAHPGIRSTNQKRDRRAGARLFAAKHNFG
jgi:hypothetical protein